MDRAGWSLSTSNFAMEALMDLDDYEGTRLLMGIVNRLSDRRIHDYASARRINTNSYAIIVRDRLEWYELRWRYGPIAAVWNAQWDTPDCPNHLQETNWSMSTTDPTQRNLIDFDATEVIMQGQGAPQLSSLFRVIDDHIQEENLPNQSVLVLRDLEERRQGIVEPQSFSSNKRNLEEPGRELLPTRQSRGPYRDSISLGDFSSFQPSTRRVRITEGSELAESSDEEPSYDREINPRAQSTRNPIRARESQLEGSRVSVFASELDLTETKGTRIHRIAQKPVIMVRPAPVKVGTVDPIRYDFASRFNPVNTVRSHLSLTFVRHVVK